MQCGEQKGQLGLLVFMLWVAVPTAWTDQVIGKQRISEPGRYEGYSEPRYDGWQRSSQYITVRDGTKIAIDIFRPTQESRVHIEPLPVIWEHRRYQRAAHAPPIAMAREPCSLSWKPPAMIAVLRMHRAIAVAMEYRNEFTGRSFHN